MPIFRRFRQKLQEFLAKKQPIYDGFESLLALPLWARRQRLEAVVRAGPDAWLVFSEGIVGSGRVFFEAVCREGLEGVVAKRLDGRYRPGRRDWIKIKPRSGLPSRHDVLSS